MNLLSRLLPDPALVRLETWAIEPARPAITLTLRSRHRTTRCPLCCHRASRVHSRYERTLADLVRSREARRVRIEDILRIVSRHYKVPRNDLLSSRRSRDVVRPRQIAMYLAKALTSRSLPEIGRRFGGRDHTTVLHSVRKVEQMMKDDGDLCQEIELLKRMLEE